jgi:hypothetical protein
MERSKIFTPNQNMRNKINVTQRTKNCTLAFVSFAKRRSFYMKLPIPKDETKRKR